MAVKGPVPVGAGRTWISPETATSEPNPMPTITDAKKPVPVKVTVLPGDKYWFGDAVIAPAALAGGTDAAKDSKTMDKMHAMYIFLAFAMFPPL